MPARWKDRLIDRVANRSDRLIDLAYERARRIDPAQPLYHGVHVVDFLSRRLALAEFCLAEGCGHKAYRRMLKEVQ